MTMIERSTELLTDEMLQRFDERAPVYDRENRFFQEDFDELRTSGYLKGPLPQALGGAGLNLAAVNRLQRRLAYNAPATALGINMHLYWLGLAADVQRAGDPSCDWLLRQAADGYVLAAGHGESGNDVPVLLSSSKAERVKGGWTAALLCALTGRRDESRRWFQQADDRLTAPEVILLLPHVCNDEVLMEDSASARTANVDTDSSASTRHADGSTASDSRPRVADLAGQLKAESLPRTADRGRARRPRGGARLLIYRFDAPLIFTNSDFFVDDAYAAGVAFTADGRRSSGRHRRAGAPHRASTWRAGMDPSPSRSGRRRRARRAAGPTARRCGDRRRRRAATPVRSASCGARPTSEPCCRAKCWSAGRLRRRGPSCSRSLEPWSPTAEDGSPTLRPSPGNTACPRSSGQCTRPPSWWMVRLLPPTAPPAPSRPIRRTDIHYGDRLAAANQ